MALRYFDLLSETEWKVDDYFSSQLHLLNFDENGVGRVVSTEVVYDCRVLEIDENNKISQAVFQKKAEEEKYEQNTMPIKRVEDITVNKDDKVIHLETYSPFYKEENPVQRYLFTIIAGARNEEESK